MMIVNKPFKISIPCIICLASFLVILWLLFFFEAFHIAGSISLRQVFNIPAYVSTKEQYYENLPEYNQPSVIKDTIDYFKLGDLLKDWPARETGKSYWQNSKAHPKHGKSLARLDYMNLKERELAYVYRDKEIPYILYNIPELDQAAKETFTLSGLVTHFYDTPRVVEKSKDNEFLYYTGKNLKLLEKRYPDWQEPQEDISMSFQDYLKLIETAESQSDYVGSVPLYYMTVSAYEGSRTKWIRQALPFFEPVEDTSTLFMKEPEHYRGVNCRFGMKGVIAAAHFDSRRNYIAMIRGRKRYLLSPPSQCNQMHLFPKGHPSARHSTVLWSNITEVSKYDDLYNAPATEVVLSMGEMMYLPSFWFHYIISQDASIQCNARSGESNAGKRDIAQCGFYAYKEINDKNKKHQPFLELPQQDEPQEEKSRSNNGKNKKNGKLRRKKVEEESQED